MVTKAHLKQNDFNSFKRFIKSIRCCVDMSRNLMINFATFNLQIGHYRFNDIELEYTDIIMNIAISSRMILESNSAGKYCFVKQ